MNILIVNRDNLFFGFASANRTTLYAKCLANEYNSVKIICPFAFNKFGERSFDKKTQISENIEYVITGFIPKHPREYSYWLLSISVYLFTYLKGYLRLYAEVLKKRNYFDAILIYELSSFSSFLIRILYWNRPLILELCEIPHPSVSKLQLIKRRLREWFIICLADGVLVISNALRFYVNNLSRSLNVCNIPILVDDNITSKGSEKVKKERILVHAGSILPQKDFIEVQIEAFGKAWEKINYHSSFYTFYITCELKDLLAYPKVADLIEHYNLNDRIKCVGYLSETDLDQLLDRAELSILYKENNEQNFYGFPTKFGRCTSRGVKMICSPTGELLKYGVLMNQPIVLSAKTTEIADLILKEFRQPVGNEDSSLSNAAISYFGIKAWSGVLNEFICKLRNI